MVEAKGCPNQGRQGHLIITIKITTEIGMATKQKGLTIVIGSRCCTTMIRVM
jgi:hypothetical protein